MKLQISDLMDQATDYIESGVTATYQPDRNRIKQMVFVSMEKKHCRQRLFARFRSIAACLAFLILLSATVVTAKVFLSSAGFVTEENRKDLTKKELAYSALDETAEESMVHEFSEEAGTNDGFDPYDSLNIYEVEYIQDSNVFSVPAFYLGNGDFAHMSSSDKDGIYCVKGQTILLSFNQHIADASSTARPLSVLGYKVNDVYMELEKVKENRCTYSYTVPESGAYYFSIANLGSDRTIYEQLTITVQ